MSLTGGVCDARCQAFFTSVIKNEDALRMKWFIKNQDRLLENLELEDPKLAKKLREDLKAPSEKNRSSKKSKSSKKNQEEKKKHDKVKPLIPLRPKKNGVVDISFMRPIDPKVKKILYEYGVETYIAANNYLHERYKEKPEDRFYNPECTSWDYGWRLKDHPPIPSSKVGVRSIIQTSFYSRDASALTRDPDWYRMCQTKNPKNFNDILTY